MRLRLVDDGLLHDPVRVREGSLPVAYLPARKARKVDLREGFTLESGHLLGRPLHLAQVAVAVRVPDLERVRPTFPKGIQGIQSERQPLHIQPDGRYGLRGEGLVLGRHGRHRLSDVKRVVGQNRLHALVFAGGHISPAPATELVGREHR